MIAATDYMKTFADQIREFVPRRYNVLGTDGFGRCDSRANLRHFFEVNRYYVAVAALKALAEEGEVPRDEGRRGDQEVRHRRRTSPRPGRSDGRDPTTTNERGEARWPRSK